MIRTVVEFLLMIAFVLVARAVLISVLRGVGRAGANSFGPQAPGDVNSNAPKPSQTVSGELHKDPVCGTYVAESTALRRQAGGQTFYYCSEACREKHSLVTR